MRRIALGAALLIVATFAALLAADTIGWRTAMRDGDAGLAARPQSPATWDGNAVLPLDPARRALGVESDLELRRGAVDFEALTAPGRVDYGTSASQARGEVELELADVARSAAGPRSSAADNMLGILAFSDSRRTGPSQPAPVEQSVAHFQAAVRSDPANEAAKYNLELLLHQLIAHGTRKGDSAPGGLSHGHTGAGGDLPGRGY